MQARRFRAEDAAAIVALFRDTIRRVNRKDYSAEQVRAWAPDEIDVASWAEKLANRYSVVVELDGVILGFGDIEDDGHLDHLFVHADHQGGGVGRLLLNVLEAEAHRCGIGRLFTEASITARPFFEHCGYALIAKQVVVCRGVEFVNFRMDKRLEVCNEPEALCQFVLVARRPSEHNNHRRVFLPSTAKWTF
jgi:putative acetyltransferase